MADQAETLFENQAAEDQTAAAPEVENNNTSVANPYEELLKGITDSDGRQKFETVDKALESIQHKDSHISTLESENAQLREKLEKQAKAEELLSQVKNTEQQTSSPALDPNEITKLVESTLTQRELQAKKTANKQDVAKSLMEQYKSQEKVDEYVSAKSQELGVDLFALAATSPKAAKELLGLKPQTTPTKTTQGDFNTEAFVERKDDNGPRKSVLYGATTKDLQDAWARAREKVLNSNN